MNFIFFVGLSTLQICQSPVSSWDCSLYWGGSVNFLSNSFPWKREFECRRQNILHVEECMSLSCMHLLNIGPISFALDHSPCAKDDLNKAFVHARAPAHRHRLRISFFVEVRVIADVVGSPEENRTSARLGSSSRPRGLPPASANPDRTSSAWRSDFCQESQGGWGKKQKPPWPKMAAQHACVSAPYALCDVRHTVRPRARALLRYTRKLCALPTITTCLILRRWQSRYHRHQQ